MVAREQFQRALSLLTATALRHTTPRSNRYCGDGRDSGRLQPRPWEDSSA
jgi:hypothetical protein